MFATLGEGSSSGSSDSGDKDDKSAAPASTQATPFPLGTDVEVAKGWNMKVNSAELDGNATVAAANEYSTPEAGKQFVLVNVTITNNSDQPDEPLFAIDISALPPTGVAVDSSFLMDLPGELETSAQMQPGVSVTGVIPFEIASADVAGTVLLGESTFTMDEAKDQKFFAIQ